MSSIRLQKDLNDKKKRSLIILGIITCVCLVLCLISYVSEDRTPPKLDFTYAVASVPYSSEQPLTPARFLNGVKAMDSKDGDVSANIIVKGMEMTGDQSMTITYFVRDYNGNVATANRIYHLNGSVAAVFIPEEEKPTGDDSTAATTEPVTTPEVTTTTEEAPSEETTEAPTTEPEETTPEAPVEETPEAPTEEPIEVPTEAPTEAPIEVLPSDVPVETPVEATTVDEAGRPVLIMTASEVTVPVGSTFNYTEYIAQLYDDKDDYYQLFQQVWIEGLYELNTAVPGEYPLVLRVKDSDGNQSYPVTLTVYVM